MSDDHRLGKKIEPPRAPPKPDVIEKVGPGIIRRNGKLETQIPTNGPQHAPVPQGEVYVFTPQGWELVAEALRRQVQDQFPLNEFGVM